jgi:golgi SNAP receptor complex member 2
MLSELLPEEKRRLHEIEQQLIELEKGNATIQTSDIYIGLQEMQSRLLELEKLLHKESKTKKDDFRRRLQHLRASHHHVQESLESLIQRTGANDFNLQRAKLLASSSQLGSSKDLELEMAENGSLLRSSKMVNEYLVLGQDTLGDLVGQRERLKSIQRKTFDMLNYLGLSNTLLKNVEKREDIDKLIVFSGMFVVCMVLLAIWWFLRR